MVRSDIHTGSVRELLEDVLSEASGEPLLINPTQRTIRELVESYQDPDSLPLVRLLADEQPLKELTEDFLVASALADLVAEGALDVRVLSAVPRHSLLLTEDFVVSLVEGEEMVAGLTTREEEFVESLHSEYEQHWSEASEFSFRTPPLSHIRETLEADISSAVVEDFDRVLESLDTAKGDGDGLDEVTIALLVAANNGELLYDISRWGEDIRLASKATFSRNKNRLEEAGLIDTEKVPIDVGRPRLRLVLANGALEEADIEAVAERAQDELS